jgi:hypothetical protein
MTVLILSLFGVAIALGAASILAIQQYKINKGSLTIDPAYNGPAQVSTTLHAIIRVLLRRSVHIRKFLVQYILHMLVRVMYYIDIWSSFMYSKARNWFVKNAVRNRGTVPHFWEHLKVYKQEMDKEKDEE